MMLLRHVKIISVGLLVMLAASVFAAGKIWPRYRGAWFSVSYPPGWSVRPSLKSYSDKDGYDSAFFRSPDKKMEFYVFSPQWSGDPADIKLKPRTEKQVSRKLQVKGTSTATFVTIQAKNNSYTRSYVDRQDPTNNTRLVLGVKYKNMAAYKKYKAAYAKFKGSLEQYAD